MRRPDHLAALEGTVNVEVPQDGSVDPIRMPSSADGATLEAGVIRVRFR